MQSVQSVRAKKRKIPHKINELANAIAKEFRPEKIVLFGSWAWGNPSHNSDVDLFIVKKSDKRRIERERELRALLFGKRYPPLDLLVYTPQELKRRMAINDFFVQDILTHGKVLYESQ